MPPYVAFHLGLHYLPKYLFTAGLFSIYSVNPCDSGRLVNLFFGENKFLNLLFIKILRCGV